MNLCTYVYEYFFLFAELMGMCKFSHVKIVFEAGKGEIYTYIFIY